MVDFITISAMNRLGLLGVLGGDTMICRNKGDNKEYSDKVIKEVLNHWDEIMYRKKTNQEKRVCDDVAEYMAEKYDIRKQIDSVPHILCDW